MELKSFVIFPGMVLVGVSELRSVCRAETYSKENSGNKQYISYHFPLMREDVRSFNRNFSTALSKLVKTAFYLSKGLIYQKCKITNFLAFGH